MTRSKRKRKSEVGAPKFPFFQIEWDESAESYMLDWFFECAPPGNQSFHFAIGEREMSNVFTEIVAAMFRERRKAKP